MSYVFYHYIKVKKTFYNKYTHELYMPVIYQIITIRKNKNLFTHKLNFSNLDINVFIDY